MKIGDIVRHILTNRVGVIKEIYESNANPNFIETYTIVLWFDSVTPITRPQIHYLEKIS